MSALFFPFNRFPYLLILGGLLIGFHLPVSGNPWGKDADLASRSCHATIPPVSRSLLARWGESAIKFHQDIISPADGPRSNFIPSSSQYTLEAMRKYGFFQGYAMGCDRLMRENEEEWVYRTIPNERGKLMKWNPVP